jgi:hypothetical protein
MATASESNLPDNSAHEHERELAERALFARRMHRRQMLRRGLITGAVLAIVAGLTFILYPVVVHLRTAWYLTASGLTVDWNLDEDNWMSGGVTSVAHKGRFWFSSPADPLLEYLTDLLHVQSLGLADCEVTERGLAALAPLKELRELKLSRLDHFRYGSSATGLGDGSIAALRGLDRLEILSLSGNPITDKGLPLIAQQHPALEYLEIDCTDVSDGGLAALESLKKLKSVSLGGTLVTPEGLKKLQAARPGLEIDLHIDPTVEEQLRAWRNRKP